MALKEMQDITRDTAIAIYIAIFIAIVKINVYTLVYSSNCNNEKATSSWLLSNSIRFRSRITVKIAFGIPFRSYLLCCGW
jgi:hypothetical protein